MKFEDYTNNSNFNYKKIQLPFGKFFLCEDFVVAELAHEIHVDWTIIQKIAELIIDQYGTSRKIGIISNKINSYSIDPYVWVTLSNEYVFIEPSAIIWYNESGHRAATLEKMFLKSSVQLCESLDEAIPYVLSKTKD